MKQLCSLKKSKSFLSITKRKTRPILKQNRHLVQNFTLLKLCLFLLLGIMSSALMGQTSLNFDGVDDKVSVPYIPNTFNSHDFTIEAWVNSEDGNGVIFGMGHADQNNQVIELKLVNGTVSVWHWYNNWDNISSLTPNQWNHITYTYTELTKTGEIYVNGVSAGIHNWGTSLNVTSNTFMGSIGTGYPGREFDGSIDEVRIWNTVRSPDQILNDMENHVSGENLVAIYLFDEGVSCGNNTSITTAIEEHGLSGTLTNFSLNSTCESNYTDGKLYCDPINISGAPETYVCPGTSITLSATSENGGELSWDNGVTNGEAFIINSTTTYTVSSTSTDDCETSVTITVVPPGVGGTSGIVAGTGSKATIMGGTVEFMVLYGYDSNSKSQRILIDKREFPAGDSPSDIVSLQLYDLWDGPVTYLTEDSWWAQYSISTDVALDVAGSAYSSQFRSMGVSYGVRADVNFEYDIPIIQNELTIYEGNTVDLLLSGYTGSIQWQDSLANGNWSDIIGAIDSEYSSESLSVTTYYRAEVTGCSSDFSSTAIVTVADTTSPTAVCKAITIYLDESGSITIDSLSIDNGSSDNRSLASHSLDVSSFDCNDVGANIVTMTVTDVSSNSSTCQATVTVEDNINPTAKAVNDTTLFLNADGLAVLTPESIDAGTFDNCGIDTMYLSKYNFDCSDVGYIAEPAIVGEKSAQIDVPTEGQMILLTVVDINDNHDYEWFRVIVEDTIPPVAICKDTVLELDSEGLVGLSAGAFGLGSNDACGIDGMTLSKTSFACVDLGVHKDTVTVTDVNGNSSVCIANVTVEDNIDPIVAAHDTTLFLDADGLAYLSPFSVDNGSADNCGIDTMYLSQDTFDCSDIGIFAPVQVGLKSATGELPPFGVLVRLTAEDGSGNSSYDDFFVTVLDTVSPTVETQNITVYLDENGAASIDSSDIDNGSFDNCTIETMSLDSTKFDCDEIGSNAVTLTVTDVNGNSANKMAYVTVEDTISPTALSHDTTLYLDANGLAYLTAILVDNESYDNCSIDTMYLSQDTFNCSEVGTLQDTLTVVDGSGNTTISILNVTIEDDIDPTVIAQDTVLYLNSDGIAYLTASVTGAESFDNCGIDTMYLSKDTFDCSYVGYIEPELMVAEKSATKDVDPEGVTVRLTAVDDNGNSNYTYFKVTVLDSIAPVVFCQDTFIYLDSNGVASIDTSFIFSNSGDACGVADIWLRKSNFNGSNVGPNTITVLASDVNGNIGTCTSTVTVMDTIAPEARCKDIGITLDKEGKARIYPGFIDDGSTDEGGIVSYTLDITKFSCQDIGENTVVMSVTDVGGNVSSCTSVVTIADNWLPEVACKDIEVSLGETGVAVIDSSMIDNGSSTICGISSIELSQSTFTAADLGETNITMTVSNLSGITATCEAKVTVKDEISPGASCNSITVWLTDSASYELTAANINAIASGSSDNASVYHSLQVEITPTTFDCSQVGDSVKVELSVSDEAGNTSTCEAWVYVKDSAQMLLETLDDIEISLAAGVCETAIDYPSVFTAKPCVIYTQLAGLGADGMFPVGTTVESWEVASGTEKDTISFEVIVTSENAVPTIDSIGDATANEDEGPLSIDLSGISAGGDCGAQTLSLSASNSNTALVTAMEVVYTTGDTIGQLNLTLAANASGTDSITVVVEDSEGAMTSRTFKLTVAPVNDAPYLILSLPDGAVNASKTFTVPLNALMGVVFDDIDDDMLAFDVTMEGTDTLPDWANTADGVLTAIPMLEDMGTYSFVVTATDTSGATTSDTFMLEVDGYPTAIEDLDKGVFELTMYPNPSKGLVTVETSALQAGDIEIAVMNISGAEVFRKKYQSTDPIQFNLSDQVSGMYMVLIEIDGQRVVKKLILDKK